MPTFVRCLVAAIVALSPFAARTLASAGGGSFLDFDQRFYVPGDVAIGHVSFGSGSYGLQNIHRGPFDAYLLRGDAWIEEGRIPGGAIPVGQMRVVPLEGPTYRATVRFTVPELPSGSYTIDYCDDPCTISGVGDLVGGGFQVFGSREEARAAGIVERAEHRISALHSNLQVAERKNRELASTLRGVEWAKEIAFDRARALRGELDAARSAPEERSSPAGVSGWLLFAATALLWAGRSLSHARRRPPPDLPVIPRTELIERPRELEPVP